MSLSLFKYRLKTHCSILHIFSTSACEATALRRPTNVPLLLRSRAHVCICVLVSSVQHFEAVLSQSELRQSGRGFDGGLLCVVFPYHATQQRPAQSLPQPRLSNHVSLCTGQRAPPHHHPGSVISVLVHTCTANITVKQIKNIDWSVVHGATIQPL